jgi:hypothetical protein
MAARRKRPLSAQPGRIHEIAQQQEGGQRHRRLHSRQRGRRGGEARQVAADAATGPGATQEDDRAEGEYRHQNVATCGDPGDRLVVGRGDDEERQRQQGPRGAAPRGAGSQAPDQSAGQDVERDVGRVEGPRVRAPQAEIGDKRKAPEEPVPLMLPPQSSMDQSPESSSDTTLQLG